LGRETLLRKRKTRLLNGKSGRGFGKTSAEAPSAMGQKRKRNLRFDTKKNAPEGGGKGVTEQVSQVVSGGGVPWRALRGRMRGQLLDKRGGAGGKRGHKEGSGPREGAGGRGGRRPVGEEEVIKGDGEEEKFRDGYGGCHGVSKERIYHQFHCCSPQGVNQQTEGRNSRGC